jgi:hypothetical protein
VVASEVTVVTSPVDIDDEASIGVVEDVDGRGTAASAAATVADDTDADIEGPNLGPAAHF